jgi:flagella basal body P-ring formation protein FlgA
MGRGASSVFRRLATRHGTAVAANAPLYFGIAVAKQQFRLTRRQIEHVADVPASQVDAVDELGELPRQPHPHSGIAEQRRCRV